MNGIPNDPSYKQTIGVDFFLKQMVLPSDLHVAIQVLRDPWPISRNCFWPGSATLRF
jgi:hypothetical protein